VTKYSTVRKPKIAIFDYFVQPDSPVGNCHLRMLAGLADKYDFTVFAVEFENPDPSKIEFVRIPAYRRPTILLSAMFHLLAPLYYGMYRFKHRVRFDLVEKTEVFTFLGSIAYIHFCYRAYLSKHWDKSRQPGLRGILLTLDQATRAFILEPVLYRLARMLIVPSQGLARELIEVYPFTAQKIRVLPNSVDYLRLSSSPEGFHRDAFRKDLGFSKLDIVLVFVALGQFERKGLHLLLEAVSQVKNPDVKVLVVGGSKHWIEYYGVRADTLKIRHQVKFVGMQRDVAPFLWSADAFCMPSLYETFLLVAIESAAAGLPLLVPRLNGVEDYMIDGENGILLERTPESIIAGIKRLVAMDRVGRRELGNAAQLGARQYRLEIFVTNWDALIKDQLQVDREGRLVDTLGKKATNA
jgi:glycosyltransferase involved in cell wall biosynthesis